MFLVKKPGGIWEIDKRDVSLSTLQHVVGGYIEVVHIPGKSLCFVLNECGRIEGLPVNITVNGVAFVGTVAIVDTTTDDFADINPDIIDAMCRDFNAMTFGVDSIKEESNNH